MDRMYTLPSCTADLHPVCALLRMIAFPVDYRTPPQLCGLIRRLA